MCHRGRLGKAWSDTRSDLLGSCFDPAWVIAAVG